MLTIQQATPAEAMLIAGLGARSFMESHGHSGPVADIEAYVSMKFTLEVLEEELRNPDNIFHIIYYQGRAAGYSKIILSQPHPLIEEANVTKLERLYLLEEFYGVKLGLTLFEYITDLSKKAGQTGIWLFTWIRNERAISFYKKAGFKIIGHADFNISATHSNPNHIMYLSYASKPDITN